MCGDEISTYQTCHSDTRLPFVKLQVCNEEVCETKQLYLCELILIHSQDHQFEPVLAPPTTSEQHHLQIWWAYNSSKSHGRATYAIITWLKDPSMSSHFLSGISKGFAYLESNHLLESTFLLTWVSKNLDCLKTCQWSNLEHKDGSSNGLRVRITSDIWSWK